MMIYRKDKAPMIIKVRLREDPHLPLWQIERTYVRRDDHAQWRLACLIISLLWWKLVVHL